MQLDDYYERISQAGVELFAVSVDRPEASRRLKERLESRFTFLADTDGALLDAIGIRHRAGRNDGKDIAYPTAVLVDADGRVRWIFQSDTYRERARAEEIFGAIEALRVEIGELGVRTGVWLEAYVDGRVVHTVRHGKRLPVEEYLRRQGRFAYRFEPVRQDELLAEIQARVDEYWQGVE